jgi:hypothetical protein
MNLYPSYQDVTTSEDVCKIVIDKQIIEQMKNQEFWKAIKIGKKRYFRTFQDNVVTFD